MPQTERIAKLETALAEYALHYGLTRAARELMLPDQRAGGERKLSSANVVEAGGQADDALPPICALSV